MSLSLSIFFFITGLVIVIYFAEMLLKGVVGTSIGFNVSAFIISVVFIGFDPENLFVGSIASYETVYGIALGSILGAAMVAIALAFGITALVAPMKFKPTNIKILTVPLISTVLFGILILDKHLSRIDGIILLAGYLFSVFYLFRLAKKGITVKSSGEIAETLEKPVKPGKWKSMLRLVVSLVSIIIGSQMIVESAQTLIVKSGLSTNFFGMIIISLLVSIEELAREIPAAIKGKAEIAFGNVLGSILAFFLFNAGIIAVVKPITIDLEVLYFYFPMCLITVGFILYCMRAQKIDRLYGSLLVVLYLIFILGGHIISN